MALYYFDLHECGHGAVVDEEGTELPNLLAARLHAIASARSVMREEVAKGHLCLGCAMVVRDAAGVIMAVPFADAIEITLAANC